MSRFFSKFAIFTHAFVLMVSVPIWANGNTLEEIPQTLLTDPRESCSDGLVVKADHTPKASRWDAFLGWSIGAAITFAPYVALARGNFSGSGGGSGVATFSTKEDADLARAIVNRGGTLPEDLLRRAKIQTLERWEMTKGQAGPFSVRPTESAQDILQRGHENLRLLTPVVARRLEQIAAQIQFANWEGAESLPTIVDAKPVLPLGPFEVQIQLAVRFSEGNNRRGYGPTKDGVRLKVYFNKPLFSLLDPLDQAILMMHEQLYALGQASGQTNSNNVRPLVKFFFAAHADHVKRRTDNFLRPNRFTTFVQLQINRHFGDYTVFFSNLDPQTIVPNASLADRHFYAFVQLINEMRGIKNHYLALGYHPDQAAGEALRALAFNPLLSGEKAFMYLAYFFLQKKDKSLNAEALADDRRTSADYTRILALACEQVAGAAKRLVQGLTVGKIAVAYCKELQSSTPGRQPREQVELQVVE